MVVDEIETVLAEELAKLRITDVELEEVGLRREVLPPSARKVVDDPNVVAAYVCEGYACAAPTADAEELRKLVGG